MRSAQPCQRRKILPSNWTADCAQHGRSPAQGLKRSASGRRNESSVKLPTDMNKKRAVVKVISSEERTGRGARLPQNADVSKALRSGSAARDVSEKNHRKTRITPLIRGVLEEI